MLLRKHLICNTYIYIATPETIMNGRTTFSIRLNESNILNNYQWVFSENKSKPEMWIRIHIVYIHVFIFKILVLYTGGSLQDSWPLWRLWMVHSTKISEDFYDDVTRCGFADVRTVTSSTLFLSEIVYESFRRWFIFIGPKSNCKSQSRDDPS